MNKFSIVLVGLVITFSLMFSVAAYFSSTPTAYVKADTIVDIEFSNVFPGQVAIESFTMSADSESFEYSLTLTFPPYDADYDKDVRPYLLVTKPDDEKEVGDGEIDGSPYTCTGSLINPDQSDTWDVKLFVPNETGDYGCTLSIQPIDE